MRRTTAIAAGLAAALSALACQRPARDAAGDPAVLAEAVAAPTRGGEREAASALAPGELTFAARARLRDPMLRHGETMENLMWAALMLDARSVATISSWIERDIDAVDPAALGRADRDPAADEAAEDERAASLPAEFRRLQAVLIDRAEELTVAARAGDREAIAVAYGRVAEACLRCHAVYLGDRTLPEE